MAAQLIACVAIAALATTAVRAASNVVQYTYDVTGNIVSIARANPALIGISGFSPTVGPVGTVVTIVGRGFSATAAANRVSFNGVAAVVVTAKATLLTVAVPVGATTGTIALTVADNTAMGAQDFVVTLPGVPTITAFAPSSGVTGAVVTVTGANFDPSAGATTVRLNQTLATATSVTATQLAFAVPSATGSGRIRVATRTGSADSAADFIVPPSTIAASDIIATGRLVADGPAKHFSLLAADKFGLLLCDGSAGDWLSLQFANFAVNPAIGTIAYTIYNPDNTKLASGTLSAASLSIHIPALPTTGTYAVLLGTGIAQVEFDARLEANRFIPADGMTLDVARTTGQSTRALIAAATGEQKAVMVSSLMTIPVGNSLGYTIALPSGPTFRNGSATGLGTTTLFPPFPVPGTYAVVFSPATGTTQTNFKVGLLSGAALIADGAALDLAIAGAGEGARLNFVATVGENLGVGITNVVLAPNTVTQAGFSVYRPDATLLAVGACQIDGTQCSANLANLPATGSYSIIVQPASGATGNLQVWLSHDVTGTLAIGTPFSLALTRPGQNGRLAFPGAAGGLLALQFRSVVTTPAGQGIAVAVYQPDGSLLAYAHMTGTGQTLVLPALPATGSYVVFVEPESAYQGAAMASMEVLLNQR